MLDMLSTWLQVQGLSEELTLVITQFILGVLVALIIYLLSLITNKLLKRWLFAFVRRSSTHWDDILMEKKFFQRFAQLPPGILIYLAAPLFPDITVWLQRLTGAYVIIIVLMIIDSGLTALETIYNTYEISKERPIKGYLQVIKIIIFIFGAILVISTLIDQSPWVMLGGLSALTAVLMLIFQDTILGFVGSIQLIQNNMVAIGDWISMPQYDADGDVIEITVNTVKVQNWDKTISTIPTYKLVTDSFKNWRGMQDSGGRRIKRAVNIDMSSIRFCDQAMLDHFKSIRLLQDYLQQKEEEVRAYNNQLGLPPDDIINGRWLTNVGTLRAYIVEYLKANPAIHKGLTLMVRQLPPSENGLPLEIYVFSADQRWEYYEGIQSDIFDHILATLPEFGLRVFQSPSGYDMRMIAQKEK